MVQRYDFFRIFVPIMRRFIIFFMLGCCLSASAGRLKVGLALGGGGAKGAAEVGVLKAIEEAGIPIDYIAGTSVGAIVGGLYAAGYSASELDTMFRTQEWLSLLTDRRSDFSSKPYQVENGVTYIFGIPVFERNSSDTGIAGFGMMKGGRIEQLIDSMASYRGCAGFETLPTLFCCVAADFMQAREVVINNGILAKAIRASMAIPGVFKPVNIGGTLLVDGGMLNNLPVDVVKAMGADIVIAIDLQQSETTPPKPIEELTLLEPLANALGLGGLFRWATTRPDIEKYGKNVKMADIYIAPSLPDMDASSFGNKNSARMIETGYQEGRRHWQELMDLKQRLTDGH